jgi:hypothetical protein
VIYVLRDRVNRVLDSGLRGVTHMARDFETRVAAPDSWFQAQSRYSRIIVLGSSFQVSDALSISLGFTANPIGRIIVWLFVRDVAKQRVESRMNQGVSDQHSSHQYGQDIVIKVVSNQSLRGVSSRHGTTEQAEKRIGSITLENLLFDK